MKRCAGNGMCAGRACPWARGQVRLGADISGLAVAESRKPDTGSCVAGRCVCVALACGRRQHVVEGTCRTVRGRRPSVQRQGGNKTEYGAVSVVHGHSGCGRHRTCCARERGVRKRTIGRGGVGSGEGASPGLARHRRNDRGEWARVRTGWRRRVTAGRCHRPSLRRGPAERDNARMQRGSSRTRSLKRGEEERVPGPVLIVTWQTHFRNGTRGSLRLILYRSLFTLTGCTRLALSHPLLPSFPARMNNLPHS